ncbi:hypothetical protein J7L06_09655, partial [Candidatus Bathyarchaeota archaeon]|nr:hypothetical protein [Candidatus Bathyarchaeota archaeon]
RHLRRGDLEKLRVQVNSMLKMLRDPRLADSLKGVFTIHQDVTGEIERARRTLENILEAI